MPEPMVAPYGSWKSPITSDLIVAGSVSLSEIVIDGDEIYWIEMRPSEGGRNVVVRRTREGNIADVTPEPYNVRTRVHEYGGGAYTVSDGVIYFSNFLDQGLYRHEFGSDPQVLALGASMRYADAAIDRARGRMVCVREDHASGHKVINTLVDLSLKSGGAGRILVSGRDFYSNPRISPDGTQLAWIQWDHPQMPWDGTELWTGEMRDDGSITEKQQLAGGLTESIFQPEWSPDGILYFVSDRTGWWNLYRWTNEQVESVCEMQAEFGLPQWQLSSTTYGFASEDRIVCSYIDRGISHVANIFPKSGKFDPIPTRYTDVGSIRVSSEAVIFEAGSPSEPSAIVRHDFSTGALEPLRSSSDVLIEDRYLSQPQSIEYKTENGLSAHAFFYPPKNQDYIVSAGEKPPLLVISHGGPTGATSTHLRLSIQYWTSRGIAIADVNYGGSTGYGTSYRRRLYGQWGIVDVDDCVNVARHLTQIGKVDGDRLAIKGGSAGGYTTLAALTFRDVFKAGASYFGVSDLEALTKETHKFESRYLDSIIGPYPERRDLYLERSPIHHVENLSCPVILFQGLEDQIVPPNQAEMMVEALKNKGIPVAYVPFEGEQHGFRRAENIKRSLDSELYFYSRIFGFNLAQPVKPVLISNL